MKIKKFLYSQKVAPYVFVIPFILSFAIFWIYPLCSSVFMSFEKITPLKTSFVGIENYKKLLSDTVFQTAIKNSATYMFWTLVLLIPFPMLFAVLMDSNLVKAKGVWKAVLYMPALTSSYFRYSVSSDVYRVQHRTDEQNCNGTRHGAF